MLSFKQQLRSCSAGRCKSLLLLGDNWKVWRNLNFWKIEPCGRLNLHAVSQEGCPKLEISKKPLMKIHSEVKNYPTCNFPIQALMLHPLPGARQDPLLPPQVPAAARGEGNGTLRCSLPPNSPISSVAA